MNTGSNSSEGGCICGQVRYRVSGSPLIVHGCHCRGCQRNSGSAFAVNALFESDRVALISGEVEEINVPTPSGTGQDITRCSECKTAVWSNYNMGGPLRKFVRFIRVGTLDDPDQLPPDIHIYTESKVPWVILPENDQRVDESYRFRDVWSPESFARLEELIEATGIPIE